jgi:hypothetical protein
MRCRFHLATDMLPVAQHWLERGVPGALHPERIALRCPVIQGGKPCPCVDALESKVLVDRTRGRWKKNSREVEL